MPSTTYRLPFEQPIYRLEEQIARLESSEPRTPEVRDQIRVLRRERVQVPAGTFDAIVVQPTVKTRSGIFGEDGRAEVWLSDDDERVVLQLKSNLSIGSLNLYLKSHRRGSGTGSAGR